MARKRTLKPKIDRAAVEAAYEAAVRAKPSARMSIKAMQTKIATERLHEMHQAAKKVNAANSIVTVKPTYVGEALRRAAKRAADIAALAFDQRVQQAVSKVAKVVASQASKRLLGVLVPAIGAGLLLKDGIDLLRAGRKIQSGGATKDAGSQKHASVGGVVHVEGHARLNQSGSVSWVQSHNRRIT